MLSDVRAFAPQWVAISTATRTLDIADVVAYGPAGDIAARSDFVAALLSPLNLQKRRLPVSLRRLASLVTDDLSLDFDWTIAESEPVVLAGSTPPSPGSCCIAWTSEPWRASRRQSVFSGLAPKSSSHRTRSGILLSNSTRGMRI